MGDREGAVVVGASVGAAVLGKAVGARELGNAVVGHRLGLKLGYIDGVDGVALGAVVGLELGALVGTKLGCLVGLQLGQQVVSKVGFTEGLILGLLVGDAVGDKVGLSEGLIQGLLVGVLLESGFCPDEYLKVYREQMTMCSRYNNFILIRISTVQYYCKKDLAVNIFRCVTVGGITANRAEDKTRQFYIMGVACCTVSAT